MRPSLHLRHALSAGFVVVVLIPLGILGLIISLYLAKVAQDDVARDNMSVARQFETITVRHLQEPMNMLRHIRDMAEAFPTGDSLDLILDSEIRNYTYYESLMVVDTAGTVRHVGTLPALHRRIDYIGMDVSGRDSFRIPRATGRPSWSPSFISPFTGRPTLTLSIPYKSGVIIGNIDLLSLSDVAASIRASDAGTAYIIGRDGRIIAHPQKDLVLQQATATGLDILRKSAGNPGGFSLEEGGRRRLGVSLEMPETDWLVVVEQPEEEAFAFMRTLKGLMAAIVSGAAVIAFIFSRFVSRRVVDPLLALTEATRKIGEGDFSPVSSAGRYVEFAEMAGGLTTMAQALSRREAELAERNGELLRTEEELRQQVREYEQAQEELRSSEERYRSLFESSRDVVFICTEDGRLVDVNPAGISLFGYPSLEALVDHRMTDLTPRPGEWDRLHQEISENGYVQDRPTTFLGAGGQLIHTLVTATAGAAEPERPAAYRGIIRDITETKKLEQQLLHAQKMESIGTLAGGVAHDFNNILMVIISAAAMMEKSVADDPLVMRQLAMLKGAAERAAALTKSLLAFSRKQPMNPVPLDLCPLLAEATGFLRRLVPENIVIEVTLPPVPLTVHADPIQIEQVLMNLIANARDAMPSGGAVRITVTPGKLDRRFLHAEHAGSGDYAIIEFSDNGAGISEKVIERIFDPFFTTKEVGKGTGLGLSMAYGIVKQHHGFIDVSSRPGKGTVFTIYLPLIEAAPLPAHVAAAAHAPGSGTILLVEDDPAVREMGVALLAEFGYDTLTAADGIEAAAVFSEKAGEINLVILDVIMPRKNGRQVYDLIRETHPDMPVLFITGYAPENLAVELRPSGEAKFLVKPVTPDALLAAIRQELGA